MPKCYHLNILLVTLFSQLILVASLPKASFHTKSFKKSPGTDRSSLVDSEWSDVCKEFSRSRVNLRTEDAEAVDFGRVVFVNYESEGEVVVKNNEFAGVVRGFSLWEHPPFVTGGNLNKTYFLQQINFRWSNEHTFNGVDNHAELHLVHVSDEYDPTRKSNPFGNVAVVAVPILAGDNEAEIEELKPLYEKNDVEEREGIFFSPNVLLPWDTSTYYRYTGSISTPPCAEDGVTWTVMQKPIILSTEQLNALKSTHTQRDSKSAQKTKPVKIIDGRTGKLYLNIKGKESISLEQIGEINDVFASNELAIATILICASVCTLAWWRFCYRNIDTKHRMLAVPLN